MKSTENNPVEHFTDTWSEHNIQRSIVIMIASLWSYRKPTFSTGHKILVICHKRAHPISGHLPTVDVPQDTPRVDTSWVDTSHEWASLWAEPPMCGHPLVDTSHEWTPPMSGHPHEWTPPICGHPHEWTPPMSGHPHEWTPPMSGHPHEWTPLLVDAPWVDTSHMWTPPMSWHLPRVNTHEWTQRNNVFLRAFLQGRFRSSSSHSLSKELQTHPQ